MSQKPEWKDWVEDLFSPAFDITVKDILEDKTSDTPIKSKIKHVSAFDPEAVQKVYERVHLMSLAADEMHKQNVAQILGKKEDIPEKQTVRSKTADDSVDLNDSCIWSSEELAVLRKVFKSVKEHNIKLTVKNKELEKRNLYLETRLSGLMQEKDNSAVKLTETIKANNRLKIHCDSLQDGLDHSNARLTAMEEIFKEINDEKVSMAKEVQELRIQRDKDRMAISRLQLNLESQHQEGVREQMIMEENIKTKCQSEIQKLEQKIKELVTELGEEKRLHKISKKGLDHLRQHFASLPLSNIIPPNAVRQNQISKFDY